MSAGELACFGCSIFGTRYNKDSSLARKMKTPGGLGDGSGSSDSLDSATADPELVAAIQLSLLEAAIRQEEQNDLEAGDGEEDGEGVREAIKRQSQTVSEDGTLSGTSRTLPQQQKRRSCSGADPSLPSSSDLGSGSTDHPMAVPPRVNRGSIRRPAAAPGGSGADAGAAVPTADVSRSAHLSLAKQYVSEVDVEEAMIQEAIRLSLLPMQEKNEG